MAPQRSNDYPITKNNNNNNEFPRKNHALAARTRIKRQDLQKKKPFLYLSQNCNQLRSRTADQSRDSIASYFFSVNFFVRLILAHALFKRKKIYPKLHFVEKSN